MNKAYTKPTSYVMNVELEEMMILPGSLGVGKSTLEMGGITAESNDRYDYEEDDEDLW